MASYKSDAQGFLIGEVIENGRDLLRAQTQSYGVLGSIRTDVRAIRRMIGGTAAAAVRMSRPGAAPRAPTVATPVRVTRTAGGNYVGGPRPVASTPARGSVPARATAVRSTARATAAVAQPRGAGGRFIAKAGNDQGKGRGKGDGDSAGTPVLRRLSDSVGKLASAVGSAENIDPVVNATKELSSVVTPLGRGLFSLFGRSAERKKEIWYRRILKALTPKKTADQQRTGSVALVGGGGILGGLGAGLGSAAGMGLGAAAGGLLAKGRGLLGKGAGLFGRGAGLLRRVPVLGALLAGGGALSSILGDGPRDEKYKSVGEAGGMLAGGLAGAQLGAAIGTAIAPGIGTAIGGFLGGVGGALLGEKFGAKVGEWTKTLVDADLAGKALAAWSVTTSAIGAAWESLAKDAGVAWDAVTAKASEWLGTAKNALESVGTTLSNAGSAANDWIKSKTGIDVKGAASSAWSTTRDAAGSALLAAKDYGVAAASALTPNTVKRAISAGAAAATQAKAGYDEVRGNGTAAPAPATAMQRGARAAGGSIGAGINKVLATGAGFNVTENSDGTVTRQDGARNWRNNNPGNIEYGEFAKKHGAIGSDGRFAIFPTYEAGRDAKAALIFDGSGYKNKTLSDAIARYAPPSENNTGAYQRAVLAAVGGENKAMSQYTPAEREAIMDAMQRVEGYKVGRRTAVPSVAPPATVATSKMPSIVPASVPPAVPANIPRAPEVKDPAAPLNSLSGGTGREAIQVSVPETIGQNVSDRGIAHVVSGGLGSQ